HGNRRAGRAFAGALLSVQRDISHCETGLREGGRDARPGIVDEARYMTADEKTHGAADHDETERERENGPLEENPPRAFIRGLGLAPRGRRFAARSARSLFETVFAPHLSHEASSNIHRTSA